MDMFLFVLSCRIYHRAAESPSLNVNKARPVSLNFVEPATEPHSLQRLWQQRAGGDVVASPQQDYPIILSRDLAWLSSAIFRPASILVSPPAWKQRSHRQNCS